MHSESFPRITIALDGFAACGKSTLAKDLCAALDYAFIDTGAMYRAITCWALREGVEPDASLPWARWLAGLPLEWQMSDGKFRVVLDGRDIEEEIRSMSVSARVSDIAALSAVRAFLVRQQQILGQHGGVVLDGRDIGTVVFPDAELKIFVTADKEVRIKRRFEELQAKGYSVTEAEVRANLAQRDHIDSTRLDSPLQAAPDVVWMDTSAMSRALQLQIALEEARWRCQKKNGWAAR
ncbi:MAG: (d)CMP kinase [Lewinellaceae bacterium]|nr:(d)CMP kinase [Saprospiraceae bacterium]MCB9314038.1 (d)CMP kinase [Lewinellaceae bacterium]HRW76272.1 (d)CMP kinase [Saprospiraceae bacterium]